ncbi:MAG: N-acetylmuramoyl-L-alanine amidase family protein [Eubacteriales bacterium]
MKKKVVVFLGTVMVIMGMAVIVVNIVQHLNDKNITIMLDPGHGGPQENQRGAIISTGGREVTLNNQLSLKIASLLEKEGYRVVFTNDPKDETDYVSLMDRCEKANSEMPDLFISVHHDSIKDSAVKGFSIYYSSYRPNIDDEGTYVLYKNKEYNLNKVEIIGSRTHVFYEDGNTTKELISGVDVYKVRDKSPHEVVEESRVFADILYDGLNTLEYIKPLRSSKDKTITDNDLMVTRSTDMPSILVEAGFVSNNEEAIEISDTENQDALAKEMVGAINKYFDQ